MELCCRSVAARARTPHEAGRAWTRPVGTRTSDSIATTAAAGLGAMPIAAARAWRTRSTSPTSAGSASIGCAVLISKLAPEWRLQLRLRGGEKAFPALIEVGLARGLLMVLCTSAMVGHFPPSMAAEQQACARTHFRGTEIR